MTAVTTKHYDLARMTTPTTGVGAITLGSAVTGFLSFGGAGAQDQDIISYAITDGSNSETGWGVYTASGTTLTRNVFNSTNGNAPISLSGSAVVFITISSNDLAALAVQGPRLLNTVNSTNVASLADTTSITSAYNDYTVKLINIVPATQSVDIDLQFYANGAWQSSNYQGSLLTGVASSGNGWRAGTAFTAGIPLSYANRVGYTGNWGGLCARVEIFNPAAANTMITGESNYYDTTAASSVWCGLSGAWVGVYAVTGVRAISSSGNISGIMKIYGNP
jgi:hypothetical protein